MTMHKSLLGRGEKTLADYIERKQQAAAPAMTFEQWYLTNFIANRVHGLFRHDHLEIDEACRMAWKAGQENK